MHTLDAVVELAKKGFTYDQIKDLMENTDQAVIEPDDNQPEPDNTDPEPNGDGQSGAEPEPEPDYKALYEQSQKELKAAQAINKQQDHASEVKTEDEIVQEIIATFF